MELGDDEISRSPLNGLINYEKFRRQDIELDINQREDHNPQNGLCVEKSSRIDKKPNHLFIEVPFKNKPPDKETKSFSNID